MNVFGWGFFRATCLREFCGFIELWIFSFLLFKQATLSAAIGSGTACTPSTMRLTPHCASSQPGVSWR